MKQLLILISLSISTLAFSQAKIGFTGGVNMSNGIETQIDFYELDPKTSYNFGMSLDLSISEKLSFEPMLLFSNKGWIETYNTGNGNETENTLQYLSAQLITKYHIIKGIKLIGGPEFSYLLRAQSSLSTEPLVGIFNEGEMAFFAGIEISFLKKISLHAKYNLGINPSSDTFFTDANGSILGDSSIKNRTVMIGATIYPFKIDIN